MESLKNKVVMIIEDEKYPQEQIKSILAEVCTSDQSIEYIVTDMVSYAQEKVQQQGENIDLITLDGSLGGGNPVDFIVFCKNNYPEIVDKIVIYSGSDWFVNTIGGYHNIPAFDKNHCIPERRNTRDEDIAQKFRETLYNTLMS